MFQQAKCTTALRERMSQPSVTIHGRNLIPETASLSLNAIQTRWAYPKLDPQNRNHPFRLDGLLPVKRGCELRSNPKAESCCLTRRNWLRLRHKATTCSSNNRLALTCSGNRSLRSRRHSDHMASCASIAP